MIKVGIVGTGLIAWYHARAINTLVDTISLVAASDVVAEKLEELRLLGGPAQRDERARDDRRRDVPGGDDRRRDIPGGDVRR